MRIVMYEESHLVKQHRGSLPVILTSPHGGRQNPPGIKVRDRDATPADCQFELDGDLETALITQSVAQQILDLTGLSPYVVIAEYRRRFVDANRPEICAFTDPNAQPLYAEYHDRIAGYVDEIRRQNANRGFLFDIHGFRQIVSDPIDIHLGTDNGGSLLPGFCRASLFMQHGLAGQLISARHINPGGPDLPPVQYRVFPPDAKTPENSSLDGGFTVQHYGAFISSIQIEIADVIRNDVEKRQLLILDLALAIINFVRRHARF
ncbi:MAG TPA: hypothetical protein VJ302_05285 [Blastocatellia bacterium]|nr:hypothetical protein [Blastocatellia bacterium]